MPRHATDTSYGASRGNKGGPGRPGSLPDTYWKRLANITARTKTLEAVEAILGNPNHPHFKAVWAEAMDRTAGKVTSPVDVTSAGAPLNPSERTARLAALAQALSAPDHP